MIISRQMVDSLTNELVVVVHNVEALNEWNRMIIFNIIWIKVNLLEKIQAIRISVGIVHYFLTELGMVYRLIYDQMIRMIYINKGKRLKLIYFKLTMVTPFHFSKVLWIVNTWPISNPPDKQSNVLAVGFRKSHSTDLLSEGTKK